jgi:raffinose/stachyose/melibiose transport system substrate-binding protein
MKMKKNVLFFLVMIAALSGCSFFEPKVTLKLFHYKNDIASQMGQLTDDFHKKNPKISVEIEYIPYVEPYFLMQRFKTPSEKANIPDIFMIQSYNVMAEFAKDGYLADLSKEKFVGRIFDQAKRSVSYDGKIYAFPFNLDGIGVVYNRVIFGKLNLKVPKTFQDLESLSEQLKKNHIVPFSSSIKDSWPLGYLFCMSYSASMGNNDSKLAGLVDRMNSGSGSLDNNNLESVFKVLDFYKENGGNNFLNSGWTNQTGNFANNKSAMMVQSLYSYSVSKNINPGLDAGLFAFPFTGDEHETRLYADVDSVFAISSRSDKYKIKASNKFFEYLASDDGVRICMNVLKTVPAVKGADTGSLDAPFRDMYGYFMGNDVTMQTFRIWNPDVLEYSKLLMQDYYYGRTDRLKLIKSLDDKWKSSLKK